MSPQINLTWWMIMVESCTKKLKEVRMQKDKIFSILILSRPFCIQTSFYTVYLMKVLAIMMIYSTIKLSKNPQNDFCFMTASSNVRTSLWVTQKSRILWKIIRIWLYTDLEISCCTCILFIRKIKEYFTKKVFFIPSPVCSLLNMIQYSVIHICAGTGRVRTSPFRLKGCRFLNIKALNNRS